MSKMQGKPSKFANLTGQAKPEELIDTPVEATEIIQEDQISKEKEGEPMEQTEDAVKVDEQKEPEITIQPLTASQAEAAEQANKEYIKKQKTEETVSELGTISSATTITGIISSNGHIKMHGEVFGDLHILGDVSITGKVAGTIEGNKIELEGSNTVGDIHARGDVLIGADSAVKGDIKGQTITVDGKVEGNTVAQVSIHMAKTAIVKGAVTSPTLSIISGAEFQGKVNVTK